MTVTEMAPLIVLKSRFGNTEAISQASVRAEVLKYAAITTSRKNPLTRLMRVAAKIIPVEIPMLRLFVLGDEAC